MLPGHESVVCNLCGVADNDPFCRKKDMTLVQCRRCGLVYVNPRIDEASLHEHYNGGHSSRISYYLDAEPADRKTYNLLLQRLETLLPGKGRLLDVGPNIGTCLDVARSRGWDVFGIEINAAAAAYCRDQRDLSVVTGVLTDDAFEAESFDAIMLGDVIEHVRDPLAMMKCARRLLKPGGLAVLSTPNIASLAGRLLQIKPIEHLYYFAPDTMTRLLGKAGFDEISVEMFDRHRNVTAMTHSTTLGGLFQVLAPVMRLAHRLAGDVPLRLPLGENLLAFARNPRTLKSMLAAGPEQAGASVALKR